MDMKIRLRYVEGLPPRATALNRNVLLQKAFLAPLDSVLPFILVRGLGLPLVIISTFPYTH